MLDRALISYYPSIKSFSSILTYLLSPFSVSFVMKTLVTFVIVTLLPCVIAIQIDPAIPCRNSLDCISFSRNLKDAFCMDGFCACRHNTEVKNCSSVDVSHHENRSIGPLVYRTCKHDQECQFHKGFCNTTISQCECQKDYVPSSNRQQCLEKAQRIDFPCVDEKQCLAFLPNTTCHYGQCTCATGYHYVDNFCYRTVDFGNACIKPQECSHIEGAVCNEKNICGCPAETVINTNKTKCLAVARNILDNCTESVQCSMTFSGSLCIDNKCQCSDLYHFEEDLNRCIVSKALDEDCGNSYDCYQVEDESDNRSEKAVQCLSNKCVCAENYYRDSNICVSTGISISSSALSILLLAWTCVSFW